MQGVKELWSDNSRADLIIEDVRLDGVNTKITKDLTFGFSNSDPGGVDFKVYLDPQALKAQAPQTSGASMTFEVLDQKNAVNGQDLKDNPYDGLKFMLGTQEVNLKFDLINGPDATYDMLVDAINSALNKAGYSTLSASKGELFTILNNKGDSVDGYRIVLTNSGSEELSEVEGGLTWQSSQGVPSYSDLYTNVYAGDPNTVCNLITANIVLDNVGRVKWDSCDTDRWYNGSESGEMIVGSMATRGGVEKFEVKVEQGSWLKSLSSTNNTLQEVSINNGIIKDGSLYLGHTDAVATSAGVKTDDNLLHWQDAPKHMSGGGLTDVRVLDASNFGGVFPSTPSGETEGPNGQLKVYAEITHETFDKYLNAIDPDTGKPNAEDVFFKYNLGKGNDALNMVVNKFVAGDVDFNLDIDGGAGSDNIHFRFVETNGNRSDNGNWLNNQMILKNVTINGGDGNDTITTAGAGSVEIIAGAGNDTVYTDNDGNLTANNFGKAVFVLNARSNSVADRAIRIDPASGAMPLNDDIASAPNHTWNIARTANATDTAFNVNVSYMGYAVNVNIPLTEITWSAADANVGTVSDLVLNQWIKKAINDDAVLSKILVAKDGPAHSLILESLVDGNHATDNCLSVSFNGNNMTLDSNLNPAYVEQFATQNGTDVTGADSTAHSDNFIDLGTGNDVLVMGTGAYSNDTLILNANFGNDVVFNFQGEIAGAAALPTNIDKIDVAAFGITDGFAFNTDTSVEANSISVLNGKAGNVEELNKMFTDANYTFARDSKMVFFVHEAADDVYKVFSATTDAEGKVNATYQGSLELAELYGNTTLAGYHYLGENNFNSSLPNGGINPPTPGDVTPKSLANGGNENALGGKFQYTVAKPVGNEAATVMNFAVGGETEYDYLVLTGVTANNVTLDAGTYGDNKIDIIYSVGSGTKMQITLTGITSEVEGALAEGDILSLNAALGYDAISFIA